MLKKGAVTQPGTCHPKRPIQGFNCQRREVSGERFWRLFQDICSEADNFFRHCFVYNHCPIAFLKESGKNVTPPELPIGLRTKIAEVCDDTLINVINLLKTEEILAIGKYAEKRVKDLIKNGRTKVKVNFLMHPSPINPLANKDWNGIALQTLHDIGIIEFLKPSVKQ